MSRQHRTGYKKITKEDVEKALDDILDKHKNNSAGQFILWCGAGTAKSFRKAAIKCINAPKRKEVLHKNRKKRWTKETREKYAAIKRAALAEKEKELLSQNII